MTIPRVSVKNLMTLYALRSKRRLADNELVAQVARLPQEEIVRQIAAVLDAHEGDIPVEAVRELGLSLNQGALFLPNAKVGDAMQTPMGAEALRMAALYAAEVYFGAARSLDLLADRYDDEMAEERDLEDEMKLDE
jgi:hypothetical protein